MPSYEYHCDACEHHFDECQSMTEAPLKKCPKCKKSKLRRIFGTGAAVLFKGSGFYQTDYRSESYKSGEKAEKDATAPKTEGGENKKDTPATKSEPSAKPAKPAKSNTSSKV